MSEDSGVCFHVFSPDLLASVRYTITSVLFCNDFFPLRKTLRMISRPAGPKFGLAGEDQQGENTIEECAILR